MSKWIQHVKQYQAINGGTYKEAMQNARATYNPNNDVTTGGSFKSVLNKAKKGVKNVNKISRQVNHGIDKYGNIVEQFNPELAAQLDQVSQV